MKKNKKSNSVANAVKSIVLSAILGVCPQAWEVAQASGFGLYEASAKTYALGGAVLGKAVDASANFHNPATLTDLTNTTISVGFMTEHPRGRMKTDKTDGRTSAMDAGVFVLPSFQMAVPLPWDFTFGLGMMPEYGLGSEYCGDWDLSFNSVDTTVTSFTVNPNIAYKITDDWSIGGGMRFLFFDFEQHSYPVVTGAGHRFKNRLKGDNEMKDFGYQIGTKYDITDTFSVGLVYKSMTRVQVEGTSRNSSLAASGDPYYETLAYAAAQKSGDAKTTLDLPQSITAGFNWDITPTWHLGGMVSWTEWSSIGTLNFHLPGQNKPIKLEWEDTWRFGIAPSWDFAEDWTLLGSYVFETDCCGDQDSTMLPPSERHMVSLGLDWQISDNWSACLTYGLILMDGKDSDCTEVNVSKETYHYSAHRALSHAAGFTLTYKF